MREHPSALSRRTFIGGAVTVGIIAALSPITASAKTAAEAQAEADAANNQLTSLNADLRVATDDYKKALDEQEAAQVAMDAEQVKIDEADKLISEHREKLSMRARDMYRTGPAAFLDFILGSTSFKNLTQNWDILTRMNENDSQMIDEVNTLLEELQAAKDEYSRQEKIAAEKTAEAKKLKEEIEAKVSQATELFNSLDAEAQTLFSEEQAAATRAAAEQAASQQAAARDSSGNSGGGGGYAPPRYQTGGSVGSYDSVVGYALSRKGCPYDWAAEGPDSFDCSGLVRWAYLQVGVSLPHQTESLLACATNVVPVSQARPGDVLYAPGHVGIAVGAGGYPYVHAPTQGAYVRDTDGPSWNGGFTCALQF